MPIKKNQQDKYARVTHIIDIFLKLKEVAIILAAILLWILGVWFTNKLSPIRKDLQGAVSTANANTEKLTECQERNENIDTKLDKLIISVSEIKGILKGKEILN